MTHFGGIALINYIQFFPKALIWPDEIKGLDSLMAEAVALKFIPAPLSKEQLGELIQIQGKQ